MRRSLALAVFFALFVPSTASADWLSLRSDHFQVIGNVGEGDLRNVALRFEQFRDVISQLNPAMLSEGSATPVVIVVFKGRSTYKPFMPVANGAVVPVGGFFQGGQDVNYITLTLEATDQGMAVVFHEFSHLLLRGVFADAPLWFNEGLAEYYSRFEVPSSRRANIGKPSDNHLRLLQSRSEPPMRRRSSCMPNELVSQSEPDGLRQASQALQRAIALRPGYTEAKLLLAYVYLSFGEPTSARDLLTPVVRAERTNHRAALRLGEPLLALNDIAAARAVLGPVIARATDEAEKQRARTLLAGSTELQKREAFTELTASRPRAGDGPGTKTSNTMIPVFRLLGEGERRDTGVFEAVECGPKGMVFVVRTAEGRLRARAARFEDVEFLTYRTLAAQSINCGAQTPAMEIYLTWRPPQTGSSESTEGTAVAIEILPER